ncbi:MAG: hypothetical protein JNL60_01525 [Bacteroidia bacterium]|nr:hypothetical protein [Bacteroidia bacterium]
MKNVKQYYKELGRLLYAIAIADGAVQAEEADELHSFVMKELAHYEKTYDSSGMNQAFYVDFEFEENVKSHGPLDNAVAVFKSFIEHNAEKGDQALIERSISLMETVAYAYSKKNEKNILEQVKSVTRHLADLKNL